jgi:hypothetical protein
VVNRFDVFMAFNGALLVGTTAWAFANSSFEFGLYAAVLLLVGALLWKVLRRFTYPVWMLVAFQIGVFAHFAGGFLYVDGNSLYWYEGLGIRFDRLVHFYNSGVASLVVTSVYRQAGLVLKRWEPWVVIATVFGIGAAVEVVEFFAVQVIPNTGVGDHANTIEDMVVNALGACVGYALARLLGARLGAEWIEG